MRSVKAKPYWPFAAIFLSLLIFYPELFLVRSAALMGDHYEQHYPWAYFLHTAVKNFRLPFWTFGIHCGFPIAAESQIGIFYLPNLLLSLLLPFHVAYSYALIVHFLLSGCATYLYVRQMKLEPLPAFIGAFVFLFGAAYGGAYYNITSLKTIAWFPLVLFLFEKFLVKGRQRYLWGIAFSVGMSLVAGYLQVAVLTWFVFLIYAMLRILGFGESSSLSDTVYRNEKKRDRQFLYLALTMVGASLIAAPQIYLTYILALQSNRVDISEHYAYVGSLSPFSLSTLIDPVMQRIFRGNSLYGGLFSFFLILIAFYFRDIRKNNFFRIWLVITILAFLLAVGEWSPLYVALIKLTRFYSFRTPAKFLVFICFSLAMLSAFGFQKLWQSTKNQMTGVKKTARIYLWILGTAITAASGAYYLFVHARGKILSLGEWYLRQFIYGRPGHPHSMDVYLEKLSTYPDS
ncbi:MAG: hypothetical protein HYZ83_06370, partial [Candidatus Omnitrophica bacterium]|nr:hypothetical protein [Candidatus Omnitrophota bacterium]